MCVNDGRIQFNLLLHFRKKKYVRLIRKVQLNLNITLLLLLKKVGHARLRERLTSYQSENHSPTIPANRMKEGKGETVGDKKGASS